MLEILVYLKSNFNFLENKKIDSTWCYRFIFKRSNDCRSRFWSRLLLVSVSNQRSRKTACLGLEADGLDCNTAIVFMPEKSLSSSSSFQMTFTKVKCMIPMMYVAITRRGVWGAKPSNIGMLTQISVPPT